MRETMKKMTIREIKDLLRESLLTEATCPSCGNPHAYQGLNKWECPDPDCPNFTEEQFEAEYDNLDTDLCDICNKEILFNTQGICKQCDEEDWQGVQECPYCESKDIDLRSGVCRNCGRNVYGRAP